MPSSRRAGPAKRARKTELKTKPSFSRLLEGRADRDEDFPSRRQPQIPFGLPEGGSPDPNADVRRAPGFAAAAYGQHEPAQDPAPPGPEGMPDAERLPSLDPKDIAAELAPAGRDAAALLRLRRDFAFSNHPDRVAPRLRERAALRMQIANALIDEALRRAGGAGRR